jgi:LemA protein
VTALLVVIAVVIVVAGLVVLVLFNRLVHLRNLTRESWRDIDAELQRRHDLVPNLVETVKGYAAHERATFEAVVARRAEAVATAARGPEAQGPPEHALGQGVARLLALAEQYPDLKANEQFLALQEELTDTEDRIQVARRIYNANVQAYDSLVQGFPGLVIARMFGFTTRAYFEADPVVRAAGPPSVDLSGTT